MAEDQAAKIGRSIRAKLSQVTRDVIKLAMNNLINSTPVDTGHCASNWIASYKRPFTGIVGSREAVDWGPQRSSLDLLERYDVGRDGAIFIANNVPYLRFLDQGSSQQAPANFVAMALLGGARLAPHGYKTRVKAMLNKLARGAYKRGARP